MVYLRPFPRLQVGNSFPCAFLAHHCASPSWSCVRDSASDDYVPDAEHKLRFFFFISPASDAGMTSSFIPNSIWGPSFFPPDAIQRSMFIPRHCTPVVPFGGFFADEKAMRFPHRFSVYCRGILSRLTSSFAAELFRFISVYAPRIYAWSIFVHSPDCQSNILFPVHFSRIIARVP